MRLISEAEVERVLTPAVALEAVQKAFQALSANRVSMPQRTSLPATGGAYLVMPCSVPGVGLGTKLVTVHAANNVRGLPTIHSSYVLQNDATGEPEAIIEARAMTERRTAAVSALAARYLMRKDARVLGIVGAGPQAKAQLEAHISAHPIERVVIWNRSPEAAQELAHEFNATAVPNLETLVRESDLISSATRATDGMIRGEWLRPGTHLDLVGAFTPDMSEADANTVKISSVFVDKLEAAQNGAGELIQAALHGWDWNVTELSSLVNASKPGRSSSSQITLFKSVGLAVEDLFAARAVVDALGWTCSGSFGLC
jgi:ornithine cyclodeaminase/alanine dehydrogenase-like protein (mu-crystallin family)